MSTESPQTVDGLVLYTDGSFRRQAAGWGVHGYLFTKTPLKKGIGIKQLPTESGYDAKAGLENTVTPLEYIDAFGPVTKDPTNNTAELSAAIEAFRIATELEVSNLLILMDSEYVQKGLGYVKNWVRQGWKKRDGAPVANVDYWKRLTEAKTQWVDSGKQLKIEWVRGHNGNVGNEGADVNARNGSGGGQCVKISRSPAEGYHNPKLEMNPLILKSRMLFNLGGNTAQEDQNNTYYLYNLGRQNNAGNKAQDTPAERRRKTDMLLGRRMSDATFCVVKAKEPDSFLEKIKEAHRQCYQRDIVELAVCRLDVACKPSVAQRLEQFGYSGLCLDRSTQSVLTPGDELITRTHNPPRMAYEAVDMFGTLERRLEEFLAGTQPLGIQRVDITEVCYETAEAKGNKTPKVSLRKTITNTTSTLDIPVTLNEKAVKVKLLLGVEIPTRNALAKLAGPDTKLTLLVIMQSPVSYTYGLVVETSDGAAIYQSPYTQYVIPSRGKG